MYLEIKNKGLIEPEAFTLLGGTTKRGDASKIGMFGSGNKYALAYFIRNNIGIRIFSGTEEIKIDTKEKTFRGRNMNLITVNGNYTSITTETGPGWDLWQCIREIYSNAVDEGILTFNTTSEIKTDPNNTSIYIEATPNVIEFMNKKERYIYSDNRVLFEGKNGRILKKYGDKVNVYRKGIRCFDSTNESLFDYDIFDIKINESRIVESESTMKQAIWSLWGECTDVDMIHTFLEEHVQGKKIECNGYLDYWSHENYKFNFSTAWDDVIQDRLFINYKIGGYVNDVWRHKTYFVENELYKKVIKTFGPEYSALKGVNGDTIPYRMLESTPIQQATINKALAFFNECDFPIDYPVYVAEFIVESKNIHGLAHNDAILISPSAIEKGVQYVVDVIFEEYVHLKYNCSDETRSMQNALINEMINYMKLKNCIVL